MEYKWLTISTSLYYAPSSKALGCSIPPDYVVDMGLTNVKRLGTLFPGCTIVLYYGTGVPIQFLDRVRALKNMIMVFCDSKDLRMPMLGRLSEFDVRRSDWTVTFDIHDDLRHWRVQPVIHYIQHLQHLQRTKSSPVFKPVRHASWKISDSYGTDGKVLPEHRVSISRVQSSVPNLSGNFFPDASGCMVHRTAPKVAIEPLFSTLKGAYRYTDDEIILYRWLSKMNAAYVEPHAPKFVETDFDMGGVEIVDKKMSSVQEAKSYADEIWTPNI